MLRRFVSGLAAAGLVLASGSGFGGGWAGIAFANPNLGIQDIRALYAPKEPLRKGDGYGKMEGRYKGRSWP